MADWRDRAACKGEDIDLFFPPELADDDGCQGYSEEELQRAYGPGKAICASCPVRDACQTYALTEKERWGLLGGLTPIERLRIERKKRRQRLKNRRHAESLYVDAYEAGVPLAHELHDGTLEL